MINVIFYNDISMTSGIEILIQHNCDLSLHKVENGLSMLQPEDFETQPE